MILHASVPWYAIPLSLVTVRLGVTGSEDRWKTSHGWREVSRCVPCYLIQQRPCLKAAGRSFKYATRVSLQVSLSAEWVGTTAGGTVEVVGPCDWFSAQSLRIPSQPVMPAYTGYPRRNVPDFGRVFLMLKYTDITQNTYVQSWTVTEIMTREVWNFDSCYTLVDYLIYIKTGRNMWFL